MKTGEPAAVYMTKILWQCLIPDFKLVQMNYITGSSSSVSKISQKARNSSKNYSINDIHFVELIKLVELYQR